MNTPVVWITGAGRGIGRSVAEAFARDGAIVALSSRSQAELDSLQCDLAGGGARAITVPCDIMNASAVQAAHAYIVQDAGEIDVLVNNAGISVFKTFADTSQEEFDAVMNTNYRGAVIAAKTVLPSMVDRRSGCIINVISITARKIFTNSAAYAASKSALAAAMDVLREELRGTGVRIINVIPGATDTAIWPQRIRDKNRTRMLSPAAVAETILSIYHRSREASVEEIIIRPEGGDL